MDMILSRLDFRKDGVFGVMKSMTGFQCATLEHAFPFNGHGFVPKIAEGSYVCQRGLHTLEHHPKPFEAFEILNVPPFQGKPVTKCLIHIGNFNYDSDGCILVGEAMIVGLEGGIDMISDSGDTFKAFMLCQSGVNKFNLLIR